MRSVRGGERDEKCEREREMRIVGEKERDEREREREMRGV